MRFEISVRFRSTYQPRPRSTRRRTRGWLFFLKFLAFLVVCLIAAWYAIQFTVQDKLCEFVQSKITEKFQGSGIVATVGQAKFLEGEGILLNDLSFSLASAASPGAPRDSQGGSQLTIYEALIHAPVGLAELATSSVACQAAQIRRAKLTLVRDRSGNWDFQQVLGALDLFRPNDQQPIPVSLTDCAIEIIDHSKVSKTPITLNNIDIFVLPIVHNGHPQLQINGGFQSSAISQVELTVFLDQQLQTWQASIKASQARLSENLIGMLPSDIQSELTNLQSLSAKINLAGRANGNLALDRMPSFHIRGDVSGLSIDDARLPLAVNNVSAEFELNNQGFAISRATGRLGLGQFSCNYGQRGLLVRESWHLDGWVKDFRFDHSPRLSQWLPTYCKKFCQEYSPSGTSDIQFDVTHDGQQLTRNIRGRLTDMSFSYIKMPYRVDHCQGDVILNDEVCNFKVRSVMGKQLVEFNGFAKGLGNSPTFEITISVPGDLPIDQKLLDALDAQPKLAKIIRDFNPIGRVGGTGVIKKAAPNGGVFKTFDIRLKQCTVRHNGFAYPIHNVEGLVHVENLDFTFDKLSGNHGSGSVDCNGRWDPINGLDLRFLCRSIPLNDRLRFALKPEIREIWNGFRPRGTLDMMTVDLRLPIGQEIDLSVQANMEKPTDEAEANYVSIHPIWFPYEINHVTGKVNIGQGKIKLTDFRGQHQRTWLACQGAGLYSDESWSVQLNNLLVGSLKVDEDLLAAVPKSLAPSIRQLKYDGLLTVHGELSLAGSKAPRQFNAAAGGPNNSEPTTSLAWDLRLGMDQAKMLLGFPVENVSGNVKLVGQYDGATAECRGELDINSLTIYGAQVTKIKGPIWLDNDRAAAGVLAKPTNKLANFNISPVPMPATTPRSISGQMHGGVVSLDAQMNSGPAGEFFVEATLLDGSLETFCREFAPQLENVEGRSFAKIQLHGDYTGTHSHRGQGTIQLRDSKIYELPVFLSLLKILNVRQLTRTAFDASNIDFTVSGETIHFNRMEFLGDAISLLGNGKMNLDRDIDLNFYSVMGRNLIEIPLISELYRASSQKVLWIHVDGTLDNPQTHRHVFSQLSELSDSLRQFFQPSDRQRLADRRGSTDALVPQAPSYQAGLNSETRGSANGSPSTLRR